MRIDKVRNPHGHINADNPYLTTASGLNDKKSLKEIRSKVSINDVAAVDYYGASRQQFNYTSLSPLDSSNGMKYGNSSILDRLIEVKDHEEQDYREIPSSNQKAAQGTMIRIFNDLSDKNMLIRINKKNKQILRK